MNTRRRFNFALLLLAASLSACAPAQTSGSASHPTVVTGAAYDTAHKIPVAQLDEQTPATSYVTFAECPAAAVSVSEVRQYGLDAAMQTCRASQGDIGLFLRNVALVAGGAFLAFVAFIYSLVSSGLFT